MRVRAFLILCLYLVLPATALGYTVTVHDLTTPYEVLPISNPSTEQFIVGELDGYPEMIEITSDTEFELRAGIMAVESDTVPQFGGIVVRVLEPRGVAEIARLQAASVPWEATVEPVSRLSFLAGPQYIGTVASGTYRVEVSTPENFGKYVLVIGTNKERSAYGETWSAVSTFYTFAGVSRVGMLFTPLVYYPLGIILVLSGFLYTIYRTRHRLPFLKQYA